MHFVTFLGDLWQMCCGGWLWDVGVGVGGGGVAVWLALFLGSGACCGISHTGVDLVSWWSWVAVAALVVLLLGFWCWCLGGFVESTVPGC